MKMNNHLVRVIRKVEEMDIIESLMTVTTADEREKICREVERFPEFEAFMKRYNKIVSTQPNDSDYIISSEEFICTEDNVIEVAVIFIIAGIDYIEMFDETGVEFFIGALLEIEGEQEEIAQNMIQLFCYNDGCDGVNVRHCERCDVLQKIF